jgi:hypothetical protein
MQATGVTSGYALTSMTLMLLGCASAPLDLPPPSTSQTLIGKSKASILSCTGPPLSEVKHGDVTILRYYKEAPMMEESAVASKTSRPGIHHGCWARLRLEEDQVTGVEFRTVPKGVSEQGDCEELFKACRPDSH